MLIFMPFAIMGKIVVFDLNTHSKFDNSLKVLKTHSNFWCRGVNNKHHAAERWDFEFGFQTSGTNLKSHSASPREFSNFPVGFQPNSKTRLSAA